MCSLMPCPPCPCDPDPPGSNLALLKTSIRKRLRQGSPWTCIHVVIPPPVAAAAFLRLRRSPEWRGGGLTVGHGLSHTNLRGTPLCVPVCSSSAPQGCEPRTWTRLRTFTWGSGVPWAVSHQLSTLLKDIHDPRKDLRLDQKHIFGALHSSL